MEYIKKNKILFLILIILVCLILYLLNKQPEVIYEEPSIELLDNNVEIEEIIEINYVKVDIKGAVKNPGVYELLETDRVIDVIDLSGGLKEDADTSNINLSKKLKDEMVIIVDKKEEPIKIECNCPIIEDTPTEEIEGTKKEDFGSIKDDSENKNSENEEVSNVKKEDISNVTNNKEVIETSKKDKIKNDVSLEEKEDNIQNDANIEIENTDKNENIELNSKISLNAATKEQLMTLPGIGESKALAIIEYRNNSLFKSIEEITNVKGIGNSIYEKIKEYITI